MNDLLMLSVLLDYYGTLLTKTQRQVCELYYNQNFSLSEISENLSITRQGVHDSLKKAEKSLLMYEENLNILEKNTKLSTLVLKLNKITDTSNLTNDEKMQIRNLTEQINQLI